MLIDDTCETTDALGQLEQVYGSALEELIALPPIARLRRIGFLGTAAYLVGRPDTSRFAHSVSAASLALSLSQRLDLPARMRDSFVLYYLLHDIGHLPYSHVAEPLLRDIGAGPVFHEAMSRVIAVHTALVKEWCIARLHTGAVVWESVCDLLSSRGPQNEENSLLISLMRCPLNIDRVEGITRTARSLEICCPSAEQVLGGVSRDGPELVYRVNALSAAVAFWQAQQRIYRECVFGVANQAVEAMIKAALRLVLADLPRPASMLELDDAAMLALMGEHPRARHVVEWLERRECASPIWLADEWFIWQVWLRGSREGAVESSDLSSWQPGADSEALFGNGDRGVVHATRWKSFHINEGTLAQGWLFPPTLSALEDVFVSRKTPTIVPVGVFGPPVRAVEDVSHTVPEWSSITDEEVIRRLAGYGMSQIMRG